MGKNVGLTEIDKNEIINLYKQGAKCQEIGNIFGISKVRVSQIAREFGLKRQDKILDYSQEEVYEMYNMYGMYKETLEISILMDTHQKKYLKNMDSIGLVYIIYLKNIILI